MVIIKAGDVIRAEGVHSGVGEKGPWFLCKVKAEKGRGSITIWNHDESFSCAEGDMVRVVSINSVSHSNRKYQEKWYEETNADCKLESVKGPTPHSQNGFVEVPNDGDLPF